MSVGSVGRTGGSQDIPAAEPAEAAAAPVEAAVVRGGAPARGPVAAASHAAPLAHAAAAAGGFGSSHSAGTHTLNGTAWHEFSLAPSVASAAAGIVNGGMPIVVADFKVPAAALKSAAHGYAPLEAKSWASLKPGEKAWLNTVHDALMAGDDAGRRYFGTLVPSGENCAATRIQAGDAFAALLPNVLEANGVAPADLAQLSGSALTAAKKKLHDVEASYRAVLGPMLHDPALQVYKATWDNEDDTNRAGIVAVNAKTGEVRTMVVINPP